VWPPGFAVYAPVVARLGDWRPAGDLRIRFRCPFADRHRRGDLNPSGRAKVGDRGQLVVRCYGCGAGLREFAAFTGFPAQAFFPDWWSGSPSRSRRYKPVEQKEVARYAYHDAEGRVVAWKVRNDPPLNCKCRWERPVDSGLLAAAKIPPAARAVAHALLAGPYRGELTGDAWHFRPAGPRDESCGDSVVELPDARVGLYRLPELLRADPSVPVLIGEGEKKALALVALGFVATSPPHGSSSWLGDWATPFRGRRVVVIPDNDLTGLLHAEHVAGSLLAAGAAEIRLLRPGQGGYDPPPDGGDLSDWLRRMLDPGGVNWYDPVFPLPVVKVLRQLVIDCCKAAGGYVYAPAAAA
jgi:hypothetical protein